MRHRFSPETLSTMLTKATVTERYSIRKLKANEIPLQSTQRHILLRIVHDKRKSEVSR